jgi:hypothetical protein
MHKFELSTNPHDQCIKFEYINLFCLYTLRFFGIKLYLIPYLVFKPTQKKFTLVGIFVWTLLYGNS